MDISNVKFIARAISRHSIPADAPLFVFGEYQSKYVKNTFVYQDLSVDYLLRSRIQHTPAENYIISSNISTDSIIQKQNIANQFYHECAGIFTMSEWLRNDLVNNTGIAPNKVHHVGGGCNIDISKIDYSSKTGNKFLFIGKDWDRKNGKLVVDAFEKLCSTNFNCHPKLYIAGPNTKPECIQNNENIVFLGCLTYDELAAYYNMCDYFVMPSKFEAYGLVFAEALCFGLPCIGKNICAMPEFIQENKNGLLIQDDDVDELATAMSKMIAEGPAMAQFVQKKRDYYIDKYSWDSVVNRILHVLQKEGFGDSMHSFPMHEIDCDLV